MLSLTLLVVVLYIYRLEACSKPSMLKGFASFVRQNPKSDIISANTFHHLDFYCTDATNLYKRFMIGLGMNLVAKSDQSTGNHVYASYVLRSNDMTMVFTAPYSNNNQTTTALPFTSYNQATANQFSLKHGTGVQAVSVVVDDLFASIDAMVKNGAEVRVPPTTITDKFGNGDATIAEVLLYGDVHLRLVDAKNFHGSFLPNYQDVPLTDRALPFSIASATPTIGSMTQSSSSIGKKDSTYGLKRFDHVVGNLWSLEPRKSQIQRMTGFHEFAEFVAEDVGTLDSGLNSVVLANNNEFVLLPLNEPTFGTPRKSQIQTYLEQNNGEGVQHIAMFTDDIFRTLSYMRQASAWGGFEFMDPPSSEYYQSLRRRLGDTLSEEQYAAVERMGLLADRDESDGVLLQIFTKPVGDRATLFLEVIQRIGCRLPDGEQKAGCGGFGKGNFKDLFKSIENYEKKIGL